MKLTNLNHGGNIMSKADKSTIAIGTWPTPERPVRVTVPAKIAYDLNAFQRAQATILDKLGCPACCSGWDIRFDIVKDFAVDEKLNVKDLVSGGRYR
jgi:hypothetical protein